MIIKRLYIIIIFMLFMDISVFSQTLTEGFPKLMYVTARSGLRERSIPSTNGNIMDTLHYGDFVQVFHRQNNPVTINGITDYWYSTRYSNNSDRWVFGGYLSEELPLDLPVIIGKWNIIGEEQMFVQFYPNSNYGHGVKETSAATGGVWRINGNRISVDLTLYPPPGEEGEVEYETIYIQLTVIDRNNIELSYSRPMYGSSRIRLTRNRTGF